MSYFPFLAVAAGGAIGTVLRYSVALCITSHFANRQLPIATLTVNVLGSLLIGLIAGWILRETGEDRPLMYSFVVTGILGGFTTFSAFSWEVIQLLQRGEVFTSLFYIGASLLFCLSACALGVFLVKLAS
jgi:CrcB protein